MNNAGPLLRRPIFWALAVAWIVGLTLWVQMDLDTITALLKGR